MRIILNCYSELLTYKKITITLKQLSDVNNLFRTLHGEFYPNYNIFKTRLDQLLPIPRNRKYVISKSCYV